jgi:hypothetical protein
MHNMNQIFHFIGPGQLHHDFSSHERKLQQQKIVAMFILCDNILYLLSADSTVFVSILTRKLDSFNKTFSRKLQSQVTSCCNLMLSVISSHTYSFRFIMNLSCIEFRTVYCQFRDFKINPFTVSH